MRYYGAKNKLLPFIESAVKSTGLNGTSNFVDLFAGTTSVGKHFKKLGYTVYSNDILEFSYALSKTYIETNAVPDFKKLKKHLSVKDDNDLIFKYLNEIDSLDRGFIFKNYSPEGGRQYFTEVNARRVDTFRRIFQEWKESSYVNDLEYYYLITSLLKAVNLISNVTGTYGAYLKTWDKRALNDLILQPVDIITSKTKNKAFKEDANELVKELRPDILYLDPPYNSRQYSSNYFILELIARGWFDETPILSGKSGMIQYDDVKSRYCSKTDAANALEELALNASKAKFIFLSYNNEGVISQDSIMKSLQRVGEVETMTQNHQRYRSINQSDDDPRKTTEYIFKVALKRTVNKSNSLSGKEWLQNSFSIWRELNKSDEEKKLKHPAIFNLQLATKLIETFCKPNGGVILDPFAGSGTTLLAGLLKGKDVVGFDLNESYKKLFTSRAVNSYNFNANVATKYFVKDSRFLSREVEKDSVDLCITSPPYWDVLNMKRTVDVKDNINYSDEIDDIGNIESYETFLVALKKVCEEVFLVLKPKGYFVLNVMDLRKKGNFYPLHMDASKIAQEVGFSLEDFIIWDRQHEYNNMKPLGYPFKFIVNKVHEYLIILRKPSYE